MKFVCPQCKRDLAGSAECYRCESCQRVYPVVCGIPDFRLWPDPYIGIEADREKGERLWEAAQSRGFEELLRHYYAVTKENPPDLAARYVEHSLAEVAIADFVLRESGLSSAGSRLLDLGCSTGGMLIAAHRSRCAVTGVDVAFRWLVVGKARLRDAGVEATLACANAEALPFSTSSFDRVIAQDVIEHLRDPAMAISEGRRVSCPDARALWTTNNRFAPLPEPHVHLWGVGYVPRRWQPAYVALRRKDLLPYVIRMRSARELEGLFRAAGYPASSVTAAPLLAPHWKRPVLTKWLGVYNQIRANPVAGAVLKAIGPRLWVEARRSR